MFYPVDSLKRGGRFYLLWVADSWPLRFAAITHRQLWSQDICKLCDDLMEVIKNESGRPTSRFSLRLSSQLMRGLVRLYEKKVTVFLGDLCMLNANVLKHSHKKFLAVEVVPRRSSPEQPLPRPELPAEPQERVEDLIQNSGNVVINIQDITLKEATIPELQLNPNDNFGEEQPNQALQQLLSSQTVEQILQQDGQISDLLQLDQAIPQIEPILPQTEQSLPHNEGKFPQNEGQLLQDKTLMVEVDRTVEQMLHQAEVSFIHSGIDLEVDKTDKSDKSRISADKSRLMQDRQMERISEFDLSTFRKSTAPQEPMEIDLEKDDPAIPDVPLPPIPALEETAPPQVPVPEPEPVREPEPAPEVPQPAPAPQEPVDIQLEALEDNQGGRRRRARRFPIIDKRTMLSGAFLRSRIDNVHLEQRCENSSDDIVDLRVPFDILSKRFAHSGHRIPPRGSRKLLGMLRRCLVTEPRPTEQDEESEPEVVRGQRRTRSQVAAEQPEPQIHDEQLQVQPPAIEITDGEKSRELLNVPAPDLNITEQIPDLLNVTEMIPNLEVTDPAAQSPPKRPCIQPMDLQTEQIQPIDQIQSDNIQSVEQIVVDQVDQIPVEQIQPDIADLPTQVLQRVQPEDIALLPTQVLATLSQSKRSSQEDRPAKRSRPSGIQSFRESLLRDEADEKENIPPGEAMVHASLPHPAPQQAVSLSQPKSVGAMLQEAGIADVQLPARADEEQPSASRVRAHIASADTETPLGSLDRTAVSLGDSVGTTDTQRFIRNQWGIEGTMVKILHMIRAGSSPVTVHTLVSRGPTLRRARGIIAARCFTSILKLKQYGFIKITKDHETLDILDIALGPRFDNIE